MSRNTARARSGNDRTALYQTITDKIIAELGAGRVPWVQPWGTVTAKAPLRGAGATSSHRNASPRKSTAAPFPSTSGKGRMLR